MEEKAPKIWFLQLTRIVACLSVVYVHWYGLILSPNVIHNLIAQDVIPNYPSINLIDYLSIGCSYLGMNYFRGAYFGVGLFFILSGYVIPLSLKNSKPVDYLIRRIFRIYPTLIVCLLIAASAMTLVNTYLGSSEPANFFKLNRLVGNILLIRDVMHVPFIEFATWTLEIEVHFYLLFFVLFYFAIDKKIRSFIFSAIASLILANTLFFLGHHLGEQEKILGLGKLITYNGSYITFMFVGTAMYYMTSKQWTYGKGMLTLALMLVFNYLFLHTGGLQKANANTIFINHLYALVTFLTLYLMSNYIPYSKFLNKIAEISYPLYLTHGFTGYTIYFLLFNITRNVTLSCTIAFSSVLILTVLIHYFIEKPGISLSKDIIKHQIPLIKLPHFLLKRKVLNSI